MAPQESTSNITFQATSAGMEQMKRMKSGVAKAGCMGAVLVVLYIVILSEYYGTSSPWALVIPVLMALYLVAVNTFKNEVLWMNFIPIFFVLSLALPLVPIVIPYFDFMDPAPEMGTFIAPTFYSFNLPWNMIYFFGNGLMIIAGSYCFKIIQIVKLNQVDRMNIDGQVLLEEVARKYNWSVDRVMAQLSMWNEVGYFEKGGFFMDPETRRYEFHYTSLAKPAYAARAMEAKEAPQIAKNAVFVGRSRNDILKARRIERQRQMDTERLQRVEAERAWEAEVARARQSEIDRQRQAELEQQRRLQSIAPPSMQIGSRGDETSPSQFIAAAITCKKCNFLFPPGKTMKFCPMCATKQPIETCKKCGFTFHNEIDAEYCPMCGTKFADA